MGATTSSKDANRYWFFEEFKEPGNKADPKGYALKDAGTIDQPCAPWIEYKEPWGPNGVSSVYSKLKDRIWSPMAGSSNGIGISLARKRRKRKLRNSRGLLTFERPAKLIRSFMTRLVSCLRRLSVMHP